MDDRRKRVARNEMVFRAVNERLEALNDALGPLSGRMELVCECAALGCAEPISVGEAEYKAVRADIELFLVARGHLAADVERVERADEQYDIVRKRIEDLRAASDASAD